ncbi:carbohydrate ABC transporter permease [Oerskovia jenensis]|uniref:Multiple sugar transport system permease protein n=2 Tax=Oerskovia TaxID=162491 RepID=A0ABS2LDP6_9CELL|nr:MULTISPECIES: carbohydrate ABC transporter permease [Oerskovia]MBM7478531.1 multiple sugar transport system permease protein [Oerskovia jenensis]MBM7496225.1 multiple sugar transport system permease protein [Oerskovia paurometabola]
MTTLATPGTPGHPGTAAGTTTSPALTPRRRRSKSSGMDLTWRGKVVRYVVLSLAAVVTIFPFYAMVVLSLKPAAAIQFPQSLIPTNLGFAAYDRVLGAGNIWTWFGNTLIYSVVSVVLVLAFSAMAGYAFAKKKFPGREAMFWSFLAMVMVPYHVTLIPTFILMAQVGGLDTYWGLILPTLANAQAVFLMRQFIMDMPDDLFEAAKLDGASEWRIFTRIVLPLCKPILATLGTFVFLWHWNDFLWPLIMGQGTDHWTLTVGIASLQQQDVPLNMILAGATISFVPIFAAYLVAQRYFQEGVTMSGIKG